MMPLTIRSLRVANGTLLHGRKMTQRMASGKPSRPASIGSGAGYYLPRVAVGGAATVGAVAFYELISRAFGSQPPVEIEADVEWDPSWASSLDSMVQNSKDSEGAAMLVAADELRTLSGARGGRRHVVLVRHAQPEESSGKESNSLSAAGKRQAELTGKHLASLFPEVSAVYHSPSSEACATAQILKGNLLAKAPLIESHLLEEGIPIVPSPAPRSIAATPEAELAKDMARAEGAFRTHVWPPTGEQKDETSVEIVVGHGNVIRYLVCRALQLHPVSWSRLASYHAAITWLDIDHKGNVTLREFGGIGHLPKDLVIY